MTASSFLTALHAFVATAAVAGVIPYACWLAPTLHCHLTCCALITCDALPMPLMQDLSGRMLRHYEVQPLHLDHARQLFRCWQRTQPSVGHIGELQGLEDAIVEACAGLPLALQLTGAELRGVSGSGGWQVGRLPWTGGNRACAHAVVEVKVWGVCTTFAAALATQCPAARLIGCKAYKAGCLPLQGPDIGCTHCFCAAVSVLLPLCHVCSMC
jgi:hypothetical protein